MQDDPNKIQTDTIHSDLDTIGSSALPPMSTHLRAPAGKLQFLKSWKFWVVVLLLLLAAAVAMWFVQPSRLWVVNRLGLRTPFSATTRTFAEGAQPSALLKNVTVTVNDILLTSDEQGVVNANVTYGLQKIVATKQGYETVEVQEFYDFDPFFNMLDKDKQVAPRNTDIRLKSIGLPLSFRAVDWLSGQPVTSGQFSVGDVVASPDEQGVISLQAPPTDSQTVKVKASFSNGAYIEREFELVLPVQADHAETFVPGGKTYFASRRSGSLGVYKSNLDGSDVQAFIEPSANETAGMVFALSPSGAYAVLASTREGKKVGGKVVQKLYVVNLSSGQFTAVDEAEWFDVIDWAGDNAIYTAARNSQGQVLASLNVAKAEKTDMAQAASFASTRVSLGMVVYIASLRADQADAANSPVLRTVTVNGTSEKTIGSKVQELTQNDSDSFAYKTADNSWHGYNTNTGMVSNITAPKSTDRSFLNSPSPDGQMRLLVDKVDGKTTILTKSIATGAETAILAVPGLHGPLHWLSNTAIVFTDTADSTQYLISTKSQQAKKVSEVTLSQSSPTAGFQFY